jgi:hypothetical protein
MEQGSVFMLWVEMNRDVPALEPRDFAKAVTRCHIHLSGKTNDVMCFVFEVQHPLLCCRNYKKLKVPSRHELGNLFESHFKPRLTCFLLSACQV